MFNNEEKELLTRIFYSKFHAEKHLYLLAKYFTSFVNQKNHVCTHYMVLSKVHYLKIEPNLCNNEISDFGSIRTEIYQEFKHIYSSIIRHLKKTVLKVHHQCITKTKQELRYYEHSEIECRYAYAYLKFRQFNDALSNMEQVENGKNGRTSRWKEKKIYAHSNIEDIIINEIYDKWLHWITINPNLNKIAFKYIIFRIMAHILYYHFFDVLKNSKTTDPKAYPYLFLSSIPFFAVQFPKKIDEDFTFHWWMLNYEWITNLKCKNHA